MDIMPKFKKYDVSNKVNVYILAEKEKIYCVVGESERKYFTDLVREGIMKQRELGLVIEPNNLKGLRIQKQVPLTPEDYQYVHNISNSQGIKLTKFLEGCLELRCQEKG